MDLLGFSWDIMEFYLIFWESMEIKWGFIWIQYNVFWGYRGYNGSLLGCNVILR